MPRSMNMSGVAMGSRMGPPTIGLEQAGMLQDFKLIPWSHSGGEFVARVATVRLCKTPFLGIVKVMSPKE